MSDLTASGNAKRTPFQRERDLVKVSNLYLSGHTQHEIAEEINETPEYVLTGITITQQTISSDLKLLHRRWLKESNYKIDRYKARELARLDKIEREYWQAWERSIEKKPIIAPNGKVVMIDDEIQYFSPDGDPRFLAGIERIVEQRRKIFGIDAPTKIAPTTPDGENPYMYAEGSELISLARRIANAEDTQE
jgi:hypothetical protein